MARPPVVRQPGPSGFAELPDAAEPAPEPSGRRPVIEADDGSRANPAPAVGGKQQWATA